MSVKVNRVVKFFNKFSSNGVIVNKQIKMLEKNTKAPIYQKRYLNGTFALLQGTNNGSLQRDVFCLIRPDGSIVVKSTNNEYLKDGYKLHTSERVVGHSFYSNASGYKKQVLYNLNSKDSSQQVEEYAKKDHRMASYDSENNLGWVSRLFVYSRAARKSEFPATRLGGSLHPAVAEKYERKNGDLIWIEKYPHL